MKHNNDFRYDLKLGLKGESHLARILTDKKIEVKTDFKAMQTGNVFVEYESRNNPIVIATTEAEYYAFIISNETIILIETERLKELCRNYLGTDNDKKGGDMDSSKGILLPLKVLIN